MASQPQSFRTHQVISTSTLFASRNPKLIIDPVTTEYDFPAI